MARKKTTETIETNDQIMEEFMAATSYTDNPDETLFTEYEESIGNMPDPEPKDVPAAEPTPQPAIKVTMNDIARAAFIQYRKANAIPDKEVDDFTIRELKQSNDHLRGVIKSVCNDGKFNESNNNTALMTSLVLAYLNEVDLDQYYSF